MYITDAKSITSAVVELRPDYFIDLTQIFLLLLASKWLMAFQVEVFSLTALKNSFTTMKVLICFD